LAQFPVPTETRKEAKALFVDAVEKALKFTRPIHTILRYWDTTDVEPSAATLFFVNKNGWALTCKHVADLLFTDINKRLDAYRAEVAGVKKNKRTRNVVNQLATKYGFRRGTIIELRNKLVGCIEGPLSLEARVHPSYDVALLKFSNYTKLLCADFPVFAQDGGALKPGKSVCRLGFPFAEFSAFEYDKGSDSIRWTSVGREDTPVFPIDGMMTRNLIDKAQIVGFELSAPGLKGQSGGPAFDTEARVLGMQCATNHLDLQLM
jgi:hypothetical protein